MASKDTGTTSRRGLGVGSVVHPQKHHQGYTKKPTETRARIDELTAENIGKSSKKESPMANPNFGGGGERKG